MKEIIFQGRGGQGTVVAAEMLAESLADEGKWVAAFPSFGPERRGAPVDAFIRFGEEKITKVSLIENADCLMVLDRKRAKATPKHPNIKPGGTLILNIAKDFDAGDYDNVDHLARVDATNIAYEEIGRDISNSVMLGAFSKATGWVGLEALKESLKIYFKGSLLEKNIQCLKRGYEETDIIVFDKEHSA